MIKPITPDEIKKKKKDFIPEFVIAAFNELLIKHYNGKSAIINQDEVIDLICKKADTPCKRPSIFDNGWLDVELIYSENGWKVTYEKADYNSSGSSYFEFISKEK